MNRYSRQFLRERFLQEQQSQLAEDAKIADPADAYLVLLDELEDGPENGGGDHSERAA